MSLKTRQITGGQSLPIGYPYILFNQEQGLSTEQKTQARSNLGITGTGGGQPGVDDPDAIVEFMCKGFNVSGSNGVTMLSSGSISMTSYDDIIYMRSNKGIDIEAENGSPIKLTGAVQINNVALETYIRNVIASYISTSNIITQANIGTHAVTSIQSKTGSVQLGSGLNMSGQILSASGGGGALPANIITTDNIGKYAVTSLDECTGNLLSSGAFSWMQDPGDVPGTATPTWYGTLSLQSVQGDICVRNAQGTAVLINDYSTNYETRLCGQRISIEFYEDANTNALKIGRKDGEGGTMVPYVQGGGNGSYVGDVMQIGVVWGMSQIYFETESLVASVAGVVTGFA